MSKIKVSIDQIRCRKVTHPRTQSDQIYVAYTLGIGNRDSDSVCIVGGQLSAVQRDVTRRKGLWVPRSTDGEKMEAVIDVGYASVAVLTLGLYEEDDGKLWKKMAAQDEFERMRKPEKWDWAKLDVNANCRVNYACWIKVVVKNLWIISKHLRQDDWFGFQEIVIPLYDDGSDEEITDSWNGRNEYTFARYGGQYKVTTTISVVEDE